MIEEMDYAGFEILLWIAGGALGFKLLEQFFVSPEERRWRRIYHMVPTPLVQVSDGVMVKVRGKLRYAEGPLEAPISGRPCAYFEVSVRHMVAGGGWDLLAHERRSADTVWLEDDTGAALVDLRWAHLMRRDVGEDLLTDGRLCTSDERVRAYLESRALEPGDVASFSELVLPEGTELSVVGTPQQEPDSAPLRPIGYRRRATRLHFKASRREPVLLLLGEA